MGRPQHRPARSDRIYECDNASSFSPQPVVPSVPSHASYARIPLWSSRDVRNREAAAPSLIDEEEPMTQEMTNTQAFAGGCDRVRGSDRW
jgi:hypothetical protein